MGRREDGDGKCWNKSPGEVSDWMAVLKLIMMMLIDNEKLRINYNVRQHESIHSWWSLGAVFTASISLYFYIQLNAVHLVGATKRPPERAIMNANCGCSQVKSEARPWAINCLLTYQLTFAVHRFYCNDDEWARQQTVGGCKIVLTLCAVSWSVYLYNN